MKYDVIVVGAGASGLMAAIAAAGNGSKVLVIEQKDRAGKKILATGNGKCNYTNILQHPECYRSDDSTFAMKVLSCFDVQKTINFFRELGIYPKERNGCLYPNSEQASSVVQVLLMECKRLGVNLVYNEKVIEIRKPDYTVITQHNEINQNHKSETSKVRKNYFAGNLILAPGGCASPKLGSDGSGYPLAKSFGHTIVKPLPALVQLKSPDKFCKTLSGVRINAKVTVKGNNEILAVQEGELLFTDYGISGIPIMQISRFAARSLDQGKKIVLLIDFFSDTSKENVIMLLKDRIRHSADKSIEEMMVGLFNHKLSYILIKEANLSPENRVSDISLHEIELLAGQIKNLKMNIIDTNSFENAQVCAGGVSTKEVHPDTMESKLSENLFLAGELVDVDGTCGGYNLQWAWSSGYLAGAAAAANKERGQDVK